MTHLFTYGSLMFPQVWERIVSERCDSAPATLAGYSRRAIVGEPYPGIVAAETERVAGVVYFDLSPEALERLDAFEGEWYRRTAETLILEDGATVEAEVYVMRDAFFHLLTETPWSVEQFADSGLERFAAEYAGFAAI